MVGSKCNVWESSPFGQMKTQRGRYKEHTPIQSEGLRCFRPGFEALIGFPNVRSQDKTSDTDCDLAERAADLAHTLNDRLNIRNAGNGKRPTEVILSLLCSLL